MTANPEEVKQKGAVLDKAAEAMSLAEQAARLPALPEPEQVVNLVLWRGAVMEKMCEAALAIVAREFKGRGWTTFGDTPHPGEAVIAKILDSTGIRVEYRSPDPFTTERKEDERGWYWIVHCYGEASLPDLHIRSRGVVGMASSRDPFFASARGEPIPPSEIRLENVQKKAATNLMFRAAASILGIRAYLDWERLEAFGIKREGAAQVEFGGPEAAAVAKRTCPKCNKALRLVTPKPGGKQFKPFVSCRGWRQDGTGCDYQEEYTPPAPRANGAAPAENGKGPAPAAPESPANPDPVRPATINSLVALHDTGKEQGTEWGLAPLPDWGRMTQAEAIELKARWQADLKERSEA